MPKHDVGRTLIHGLQDLIAHIEILGGRLQWVIRQERVLFDVLLRSSQDRFPANGVGPICNPGHRFRLIGIDQIILALATGQWREANQGR
jgi:hypothetical protein